MKNNISSLLKHIEAKVGLSIKDIQANSPHKTRKHIESKNGKTMKFVSAFPYIGRGNVLRDGIKDTATINKEIDKILAR